MPTKVHELFLRGLGGRISEQRRLLSREPGTAADVSKDVRDVLGLRQYDPEIWSTGHTILTVLASISGRHYPR